MAAVFFDLDGTLVDSEPGIAASIAHALSALGLAVPGRARLAACIGPPLRLSFADLGASDPEAALELYHESYEAEGLYEARLYDGVAPALDALAGQGHRLYLATAKPLAQACRVTAHLGLAPRFAAEFGPDLDGTREDKAELLAHALAVTGETARDAVMIGDRRTDIAAARAVGMAAIAVDWGFGLPGELDGADAHAATPEALPALVAACLGATARPGA